MEFYLLKNGERAGPFKIFHVVEMLRSQQVKETDMAWCSVDEHWMPLKDIPAMKGLIGESAQAVMEDDVEVEALPLSLPNSKQEVAVNSARPWMRFLARVLDYSLVFHVVAFVSVQLGLVAPAVFTGTSTDFLTTTGIWILSTYAWTFVEAWCLSRFGATLGKSLFNLRVVHEDGSLLSYKEALRRSLAVCIRGYGLGIFGLRELLSALAFIALVQDGKTPWDQQQSLKVEHGGMSTPRWIKLFVLMIGLLTMKSLIVYNIDPAARQSIDAQMEEMNQDQENASAAAHPVVFVASIERPDSIS